MSQLFMGTGALLASRRPYRAKLVVLFAVAGALLGLGLTFLGGDEEAVFVLHVLACLFAGAVGTIHAGANLTLGLGGLLVPSRREELSLLPVGRLALPAAVLAGAFGLTLATWLAWSVTFLLASAPCQEGDRALTLLLQGLGLAAGAAVALVGPIALASRTSGLLFALYVLAPGMAATLAFMGHGPEAVALFAGLACAALVLLCLGLPFAVHALGPAAIQTAKGVPTRDGAEEGLAVAAACLAAVLFVSGARPLPLALGGLVLAWNVRALRALPRPARRRLRASPVALAIMAGLLGPIVAAAWGLELRTQARADAGQGLVPRAWADACVVDPTGRRAALAVDAPYLAGFAAQRVVVVELTGPTAGRRTIVPARFPRLDRGAWSQDGRWLAVQEEAVGRLTRSGLGREGLEVPDGAAGVVALRLFGDLRGTTLVVDADSGEVQDLGRRLVAPGWRAPGELVEVELGLDGKPRLRSGDVRERLSRRWRLAGYLDGRLVLESPGDGAGVDRRFGEVTGALLRFAAAGIGPLPLEPPAWTVEGVAPAEARHPASVVVARGDDPAVRVVLEDATVEPASLGERSLLALSDAGLVRVSLPDGARTLVLPGADVVDPLAGRPGVFAARTPAGWFLLDGDASPRRLTLPVGRVPLALAADGRVVIGGAAPALVDADGGTTPLLP